MMTTRKLQALASVGALLGMLVTAVAQNQPPQLRKIVLDESPHDPFELAVAKDGRIFYVERRGQLKQCLPESRTSRLIASLKVYSELDDGLLGIALDPGFLDNNWIYLCYSTPTASENWVSRFTLEGDTLDLGSEKVLLKIKVQRDTPPCHTGGSLAFDLHGNLLISTGDNINPFKSDGYCPTDERPGRAAWDAQGSSANTNDLRGKVLRITPQPDGGVTIPRGNLFKPGLARTRPEIFAMGCRNPFRISADPKTGTVYWGEIGPDSRSANPSRGPAGFDEVNQAKQAGNHGWPHFVADNRPYRHYDFATKVSGNLWQAADPKNESVNNTGLTALPPAQAPLIWYPYSASTTFPELGSGGRSAMAGPVYYFDSASPSQRKLPAEFDRCLFIYDWMRGQILAAKLGEKEELVSLKRILPKTSFKRPMDMELGADGALYLIEWGSAYGGNNKDAQIVRIEATLAPSLPAAATAAPRTLSMVDYLPALAGGNAEAGKRLFENGAKTGCVNCHPIAGKGGVIGPALDDCGSRMTKEKILESLLFPGKEVTSGYGSLILKLKDGSNRAGMLKSEGTLELQLESPETGLLSVKTADIAERSELVSGMPQIAASLSTTEVAHLVTYLSSLKSADSWTFVSMPDFLNVDTTYPQPGWEDALDYVLKAVKAENPDFLLVAGDLVMGRWWDEETIRKHAAIYYPDWIKRMKAHDLKFYTAIGDHELGDNPWPPARAKLVPLFKKAFRDYMKMPLNGPEHMKGTAFHFLHKNSLFIAVDVFEKGKGQQGDIVAQVTGKQLAWLETTLGDHPEVDHVVVMGHTPILGPVRKRSSSGLMLEKGRQSPLWQTMARHKVDLYLCGEVHAITATERDSVQQVAHGGLFGYNPRINYLVAKVTKDRIELELKELDIICKGEKLWQVGRNRPHESVTIAENIKKRGFVEVGQMTILRTGTTRTGKDKTGYFDESSNP